MLDIYLCSVSVCLSRSISIYLCSILTDIYFSIPFQSRQSGWSDYHRTLRGLINAGISDPADVPIDIAHYHEICNGLKGITRVCIIC